MTIGWLDGAEFESHVEQDFEVQVAVNTGAQSISLEQSMKITKFNCFKRSLFLPNFVLLVT